MISDSLVEMLCCPTCHSEESPSRQAECLEAQPGCAHLQYDHSHARLVCPLCGTVYEAGHGFARVMPQAGEWAESKYSSDTFEEQLDYRDIGSPLLAAGVRQRQLNLMLPMGRQDTVIELGCGNGKFGVWNKKRCGQFVGIDAATLFADQAKRDIDLVQADARRLPFPDDSFTRALSIDVLEHFSREDVDRYLTEAWRVLRPGGLLFVYSNTRERGRYRRIIDLEHRVGEALSGIGLIDLKADKLRKSDHIKAINTLEDLQAVTSRAGFKMREIVYWNGIMLGLVELTAKLAEGLVKQARTLKSGSGRTSSTPVSEVRREMRRSVGRSQRAMFVLEAMTSLMYLDIKLWGKSRTGPFFTVLEKVEAPVRDADQP